MVCSEDPVHEARMYARRASWESIKIRHEARKSVTKGPEKGRYSNDSSSKQTSSCNAAPLSSKNHFSLLISSRRVSLPPSRA
ncbi:hypothetical protein AC249_AIPGENE24445 [Exaiptasia diaphana]|nr:hypothetical protein AC249_AIPGENE24445 [Exaiptasia diaphana]